ncbi:hypothetical protein KC358_g65 [Hortaea werneckii]|nr:hypothetical protein KC358_g65 [Hortaea werneckii]
MSSIVDPAQSQRRRPMFEEVVAFQVGAWLWYLRTSRKFSPTRRKTGFLLFEEALEGSRSAAKRALIVPDLGALLLSNSRLPSILLLLSKRSLHRRLLILQALLNHLLRMRIGIVLRIIADFRARLLGIVLEIHGAVRVLLFPVELELDLLAGLGREHFRDEEEGSDFSFQAGTRSRGSRRRLLTPVKRLRRRVRSFSSSTMMSSRAAASAAAACSAAILVDSSSSTISPLLCVVLCVVSIFIFITITFFVSPCLRVISLPIGPFCTLDDAFIFTIFFLPLLAFLFLLIAVLVLFATSNFALAFLLFSPFNFLFLSLSLLLFLLLLLTVSNLFNLFVTFPCNLIPIDLSHLLLAVRDLAMSCIDIGIPSSPSAVFSLRGCRFLRGPVFFLGMFVRRLLGFVAASTAAEAAALSPSSPSGDGVSSVVRHRQ